MYNMFIIVFLEYEVREDYFIKERKLFVYISIILMAISIICISLFFYLNKSSSVKDRSEENIPNNSSYKEEPNQEFNTLTEKQVVPWGLHKILLDKSTYTETSLSKRPVNIAIIDSGVDKNHPDLRGIVKKEYNAINPNKKTKDDFGHGTSVAGIIAAQNNKFGVVGVAPDSNIYSVKVLDSKGKGSIDNLVKAIKWCIDNDVNVINISFGFKTDNPKLRTIIHEAYEKNIVIVAAAGNNYGWEVDYPARYKETLSVTAVDKNLVRSRFSSKGKIDYSAPGRNILTTSKYGAYSTVDGTSFAAPYITGAISLIIQEGGLLDRRSPDTNLTEEVKNILNQKVNKVVPSEERELYGNGFVQFNQKEN
ncbi:Subtilase family protein [Priestia endophytica DSM 13796]|uniref:Subtilase family protein n=2 Tax=Priestia endophytica TaxID=135735 RepID=A0A1I6BY34_9BACI|nr:Subtilase family protein [Priestia endophytica DSM 13796]